MALNKQLFVGHLRFVLFFLIASVLISACDLTSSPTNEQSVNVDNPPVVKIETPLNGDTYQEGVGINILARVENAGPDISRVSIQVDGIIVGEQTAPNVSGAASFTVNTGWPASGVGQHTISVSADRGSNGMTSAPATVTINVVASSAAQGNNQQTSPQVSAPTTGNNAIQVVATNTFPAPPSAIPPTNTVPVPTNTPAPPTATPTPEIPHITVTTGANVRSGPGIVFEPPIGSLAAGAVANILAVNPAGTWYKIQYYNGDGWISAQVVQVSGDISTLPRDAGPATPIPVTNTPVPTATVPTQIDLTITNVVISPHPFVCAKASEIQVTVVNVGSSNSPSSQVVVQDIYNGQVGATTNAPVPELGPNQQYVAVLYLTVSTNFAEGHTTHVMVDPNGAVPELNEGNNSRDTPYVLATGGC